MAIYFLADTHFDDDDIRRYENRPFASTAQMNEAIITNWNNTVQPTDSVYLLGDIGNEQYISRLNGVKYLVKGNHDHRDNAYYRTIGFAEVYDLPVILQEFFILSHEPLYVNRNMPYANIFGHVHANPAYKDYSSRSFCVSVERIRYTPVSLSYVKEQLLLATQKEDADACQ